MKLNKDGLSVELDINGMHDARQLDDLLRKLALLRSQMLPPVPQTVGDLEQADASVLVEDMPGLVIAARQSGGFRLWVRHRGFGWMAYQIDERSAVGMAAYISQRTAGESVNLVKHEEPNKH